MSERDRHVQHVKENASELQLISKPHTNSMQSTHTEKVCSFIWLSFIREYFSLKCIDGSLLCSVEVYGGVPAPIVDKLTHCSANLHFTYFKTPNFTSESLLLEFVVKFMLIIPLELEIHIV